MTMKISLTFQRDRELLKNLFLDDIATIKLKDVNIDFEEIIREENTTFQFSLLAASDENRFLLPLTLAKTISFYTTKIREKEFTEAILQKYYDFLDEEMEMATAHQMKKKCADKNLLEHRQMLVFFPIINYFSKMLPEVVWNYEGFFLFRQKNYWISLNDLVVSCVEEAFFQEEKFTKVILYPCLHKPPTKDKTTPKGEKR